LRPNESDIYNNLASIYQSQGDNLKASETLQQGLRLNPNSPDIYNSLASIYQSQGDTAKAIEYYQKYLQINPNPDIYNALAAIHEDQGDYFKAISCLHKAIQLNPKSAEAYSKLGNILVIKGDREGARQQIYKLKELNEEDLAVSLEQAVDQEEARQ
jgi:Flp pilus assembly protein TadD